MVRMSCTLSALLTLSLASAGLAAGPNPGRDSGSSPGGNGAPSAATESVPKSRLSQEQAVRIASDFCHRMGTAAAGIPRVDYPINDTGISGSRPHWQTRWLVCFQDETVNVVDATGVISFYASNAVSAKWDKQPQGIPISEEEAIRRASAAMQASGQSWDELMFREASLDKNSDQTDAGQRQWFVTWKRAAGGIPYHYQEAHVILQPESGEVSMLTLNFSTDPPAPQAFRLIPQDAVKIAVKHMHDLGDVYVQEGGLNSAEAEIVEPNKQWMAPGQKRPRRTRVAWDCSFGDIPRYEVLVDVETGEVLGGDFHAPAGSGRSPQPSAAELLTNATEIRIYSRDKRAVWNTRPLAVLKPKPRFLTEEMPPEEKIFWLLKTTTREFNGKGGFYIPEYKLEVGGAGKPAAVFGYLAEKNWLGYKGQWAGTSEKFKAWMEKLIMNNG